PLVENGRLAGLVTLNRVRATPPDQRTSLRLSDIACPPEEVPTARRHYLLPDLLPRMAGCTDGRAIVVDDDDHVIGVITATDISRAPQISFLRTPPDRRIMPS